MKTSPPFLVPQVFFGYRVGFAFLVEIPGNNPEALAIVIHFYTVDAALYHRAVGRVAAFVGAPNMVNVAKLLYLTANLLSTKPSLVKNSSLRLWNSFSVI
jgi:hypothetical protein